MTHVSWQELVMHARLLDRIREIVSPIEVEQGLSDRTKDATSSRAAEGEIDFGGGRVIHDQGRSGR